MELDVLDIQTTIQPLLFIIGLDAEYLISHAGVVQVFRHHIHRQPVSFNHVPGIGKHEVTVRLQMNDTVILQELAVALHEISGSKPFGSLLHLRVRESKPDLTHFIRSKKTVEGDFSIESFLDELKNLHPAHVHLAPFMIVAGDHATNDMSGEDDDSWKSILEKEGYSVKCTLKGLGEIQAVRDIFIRHTRAGLDRLSEIQA